MKVIRIVSHQYAETILEIFNETIINSTALYEYQPKSLSDVTQWLDKKLTNHRPVLAAINEQDQLVGFASYDDFRPYPANKFTAELAVYVSPVNRGKGIAKQLLNALIDHATQDNLHVLIAGIDAQNTASIELHKKFGFKHAGTLKEVAYKFDRWLDLSFYQKKLSE